MSKIKIAIQKSGRLNESSLKLLKSCGINIENGKDQLKACSTNFPLEVFFLRNSDIPKYLNNGVVDLAIVGENLLFETDFQIDVVRKLGFSKCKVSLAIPKDVEYSEISQLNGKRIATSYPNTLQYFLSKNKVVADIHEISGSVEIAPSIGLADAVCDIVSTGSTLFKNGLKECEVIYKSEAVLACSPKISVDNEELLDKLVFRIDAVLRAKESKYILMNVPNNKIDAVTNILPVLKSPTILPLAKDGWSSLHSVIEEKEFWNVIDELKDAGAEGILVVPIDKIVA